MHPSLLEPPSSIVFRRGTSLESSWEVVQVGSLGVAREYPRGLFG